MRVEGASGFVLHCVLKSRLLYLRRKPDTSQGERNEKKFTASRFPIDTVQ